MIISFSGLIFSQYKAINIIIIIIIIIMIIIIIIIMIIIINAAFGFWNAWPRGVLYVGTPINYRMW